VPNEPARHQKDNTTNGNSTTSYGGVSSTYNTPLNNYVTPASNPSSLTTLNKTPLPGVNPPIVPNEPARHQKDNTTNGNSKTSYGGVSSTYNTPFNNYVTPASNPSSLTTLNKTPLPGVNPPINPVSALIIIEKICLFSQP
ncbi:hypothetical protein Tco_0130687, partial [Tanacetum coccineum]